MNVFISPHLDDIAYSCYGTLNNVSFPRLCIVVFNKSCYAFDMVNPAKTGEISALRLKEEMHFWDSFQTELVVLGYEDSSVRSRLEIENNAVYEAISKHLLAVGPSALYAPAGIGWHYDHIVLRNIILSFWKQFHNFYSLFLYEDLPYACEFSEDEYIRELDKLSRDHALSLLPVSFLFDGYQNDWENVIKNVYESQYNELEFLRMKKYRECQKNGIERIWKCIM